MKEGTLKKLLVLSALFAALSFFACGEKQDSSAPSKKADVAVEPAMQEDTSDTDEFVADEEAEADVPAEE